MAVTAKLYGNAMKTLMNNEWNWTSASTNVKVMLVSGYTFDQDAHIYKSSVTGELANGNGYTTRGAQLTGKTFLTYDSANNRSLATASNTSWASSTLSATGAVVYWDTGTDATSALICYVDFGGTVSSVSGTFTITWDSTYGIFYISAA